MGNIKNVIEKTEAMTGKINQYYDLTMDNLIELYENCHKPIDLINHSFKFGYLQGTKAAKSEMRKGAKKQ